MLLVFYPLNSEKVKKWIEFIIAYIKIECKLNS
uniref:Uncharacterized protein n=1 Tax=Firmicutes phage HS18 TaxID=3056396 RepID=A0AA49X3K2_9VIRU|nr:MAG: hypothetical protein [Firmicutes phage HS18]